MKNDAMFVCECDNEFLRIQKDDDESQIYISKYRIGDISTLDLWHRIKLSIGFIFKPEKYDIFDGVILSEENAKRMGYYLVSLGKSNE